MYLGLDLGTSGLKGIVIDADQNVVAEATEESAAIRALPSATGRLIVTPGARPAGADLGVAPIGLAARDTLRFEACYCLYGHELTEDWTPLEAGIGWAVKLKKKGGFIGRDVLAAQKEQGVPRKLGHGIDDLFRRQAAGAVARRVGHPGLVEALGAQLVEDTQVLALALLHHRRQQHQFAPCGHRQYLVHHLVFFVGHCKGLGIPEGLPGFLGSALEQLHHSQVKIEIVGFFMIQAF